MEVTFKGEAIQVKGKPLDKGANLPQVKLVDGQGQDVQLQDLLKDKVTILSVVPNVLTRTCELQTKYFQEATKGADYQFITVSRNSVDEFKQWNQEHGLQVFTLSDDYKEFGQAFGIEIDLGGAEVLTRSVYVVKPNLEIAYVQYVPEVSEEPDYQPAIEAAQSL